MRTDYRIALRPDDDPAYLDDVVARGVSTFRAELMSDTELWLECQFPEADQRLTMNVRATRRKGQKMRLEFTVTETPHGAGFAYEDET